MTIQGRGVVAVLVAGLLVGLGACSSSGTEPRALPSPRTTASASQSPTVEAQVEAAVRRYFDAANRALATGDTRELESLSLPGCGCRQLADLAKSRWANGGHLAGAEIVVTAIVVHDVFGATAAAEISGHVTAYKAFRSDGSVSETSPGGSVRNDLSLVRKGSRWLVAQSVDLR